MTKLTPGNKLKVGDIVLGWYRDSILPENRLLGIWSYSPSGIKITEIREASLLGRSLDEPGRIETFSDYPSRWYFKLHEPDNELGKYSL